MRQYEVTFIVDPVLSGDEIKKAAKTYNDMISKEGGKIVNEDNLGLKQLAYPINKRSSGIYFCTEFQIETGEMINRMELAFRRDERIMRFLTVHLDKYGVKYNEDKRNGLIGTKKKNDKDEVKPDPSKKPPYKDKKAKPNAEAAPVTPTPVAAAPATPAPAPTPVAAAPAVAIETVKAPEPTPVVNTKSEEE